MRLFAAYLPLSSNFEQIGRRGTRHTAALGMSERCDALVIVVSEEHGVISVAQAGALIETNASELADRLETFRKNHHATRRTWRQEVNLPLAALSLLLAVLFWFAFAMHAR